MSGPIVRQRLLQPVALSPDRVVLLAAPSGYGKSVLARQLTDSDSFDRTIWISMPGEPMSERLLEHMALEEVAVQSAPTGNEHGRSIEGDQEGAAVLLERYWRLNQDKALALVLDGVVLDEPLVRLPETIATFLRRSSQSSRVFITSRNSPGDFLPAGPMLLMTALDLRLEFSEAVELMTRLLSKEEADHGRVAELMTVSGGHMASYLVMCRLGAGKSGWDPSLLRGSSLDTQLRMVAGSGLDVHGRRTLLACAVLGRGNERDLCACLGEAPELGEVLQSVPLVSARPEHLGGYTFECHDIATSAFRSRVWASDAVDDWRGIAGAALDLLAERRDYGRLVEAAREFAPETIARFVTTCGDDMIHVGRGECLGKALEALPVGSLVASPELLVVSAKLMRERGHAREAERQARVASVLARHSGDSKTEIESLRVTEEAMFARGDLRGSKECLLSILGLVERSGSSSVEIDARSSLVMLAGQMADWELLGTQRTKLEALMESSAEDSSGMARAQLRLASVQMGILGEIEEGIRRAVTLADEPGIRVSVRQEALANAAAGLAFCGRLTRARTLLGRSQELVASHELGVDATATLGADANVLAAEGDLVGALASTDLLLRDAESHGDYINAHYARLFRAMICTASGRWDEALADSENALEYFTGNNSVVFRWQAVVELGCAVVGLGDGRSGRVHLEGVLAEVGPHVDKMHLTRGLLVLAELDRLEHGPYHAIDSMRRWADLASRPVATWHSAMTVRAFPGILGLLSAALAPARLPLHMLRMVGNEKLDEGIEIARAWMEPAQVEALIANVDPARPPRDQEIIEPDPRCHVRLFGGLEVRTPYGVVGERDWKKRKARLLFAMLVARRGQDVPRDQIFEHLWPEMDEERARNNFYVIFNAMKSAVTAGHSKGKPCPYVVNTSGLCSIDRDLVHSDLDDFENALAEARAAEAAGDPKTAIDAYSRMAETYRGDLLPGDIYDDWFATMRDSYRQEFSDAMLRAATLLEAGDDIKGALHLVRRALAHDPWREDLYQTAIRYQILAGQRSAAVETYMTCRSRLADDLGLDPSVETRRLYDEILAMETDVQWA